MFSGMIIGKIRNILYNAWDWRWEQMFNVEGDKCFLLVLTNVASRPNSISLDHRSDEPKT